MPVDLDADLNGTDDNVCLIAVLQYRGSSTETAWAAECSAVCEADWHGGCRVAGCHQLSVPHL